MGFRQGGLMTVWSVEPKGNITKVRLSSSKKNKQTDTYEQDFSGFCTFIGQANTAASGLREKDKIRLLSCDVGTSYNKDTRVNYTDFKVFDFEMADGFNSGGTAAAAPEPAKPQARRAAIADDIDTPF